MGLGVSIDPKKFADAAGDKAQLEILAASLPRRSVVVQGWATGLQHIRQHAITKKIEWNRLRPTETTTPPLQTTCRQHVRCDGQPVSKLGSQWQCGRIS